MTLKVKFKFKHNWQIFHLDFLENQAILTKILFHLSFSILSYFSIIRLSEFFF